LHCIAPACVGLHCILLCCVADETQLFLRIIECKELAGEYVPGKVAAGGDLETPPSPRQCTPQQATVTDGLCQGKHVDAYFPGAEQIRSVLRYAKTKPTGCKENMLTTDKHSAEAYAAPKRTSSRKTTAGAMARATSNASLTAFSLSPLLQRIGIGMRSVAAASRVRPLAEACLQRGHGVLMTALSRPFCDGPAAQLAAGLQGAGCACLHAVVGKALNAA
jgi:hypothetical protein